MKRFLDIVEAVLAPLLAVTLFMIAGMALFGDVEFSPEFVGAICILYAGSVIRDERQSCPQCKAAKDAEKKDK